jgi:ABC-type multidrug transport system ATPase subunit
MDEAVRCERVALIQRGRILDVGDPRRMGARFDRPLFAVRSGDRVRLLRALRDHPHAHSVFPFGADVHFTDARADLGAEATVSELRRHLAAHGLADASVAVIEPDIEDVFMALMQATPRAA